MSVSHVPQANAELQHFKGQLEMAFKNTKEKINGSTCLQTDKEKTNTKEAEADPQLQYPKPPNLNPILLKAEHKFMSKGN